MELASFLSIPAVEGILWLLGGLVLAYVFVLSIRVLEGAAHRVRANLLATLLARLSIPCAVALVLGGIYASLPSFGATRQWMYYLLISFFIILGAYAVIAAMTSLIGTWITTIARKTATRADDNFLPLVQGFFKLAVLAAAFAWILTTWGVHIGPLIAGLGIAGLAVGLALQKTMANIIGGIALILDDTYNVGDTVHLDTGEVGEVIHIGLRSTKILTEDQQLMVLPNDAMANAKIINYALPNETLRLVIDANVAYGTDADKAKKVVLSALRGLVGVCTKPAPVVHFIALGDSALQLKLKFFIHDYRRRHDMRSIVTQRVYEALNAAKIAIPYPTRIVHLKK